MFRLVILSCLLCGVALSQDSGSASTVAPTAASEAFIPVPSITEAKNSQAAANEKYSLFHIKLNWYQALEMCFQMGKRLGTFDSQAEYNQLVGLIKQKEGDDLSVNYWTAGSDLGEKGKFVWLSTGRPLTYTNWWPGEPSHSVKSGVMEQCVDLRAEYHYRMNDNLCSVPQYVICETNN